MKPNDKGCPTMKSHKLVKNPDSSGTNITTKSFKPKTFHPKYPSLSSLSNQHTPDLENPMQYVVTQVLHPSLGTPPYGHAALQVDSWVSSRTPMGGTSSSMASRNNQTNNDKKKKGTLLWHVHFGHLSYSTLQQAHRDGLVDGFPYFYLGVLSSLGNIISPFLRRLHTYLQNHFSWFIRTCAVHYLWNP